MRLTRHILSNNQSIPRSSSQLNMTVLPSPSLAKASSVSMDTPSILLIAVKAGIYFLVPSRTSINSSSVICHQPNHQLGVGPTHIFSDHDVAIVYWVISFATLHIHVSLLRYVCRIDRIVRSFVCVSLTVIVTCDISIASPEGGGTYGNTTRGLLSEHHIRRFSIQTNPNSFQLDFQHPFLLCCFRRVNWFISYA
jgi:hypothetical protein